MKFVLPFVLLGLVVLMSMSGCYRTGHLCECQTDTAFKSYDLGGGQHSSANDKCNAIKKQEGWADCRMIILK